MSPHLYVRICAPHGTTDVPNRGIKCSLGSIRVFTRSRINQYVLSICCWIHVMSDTNSGSVPRCNHVLGGGFAGKCSLGWDLLGSSGSYFVIP